MTQTADALARAQCAEQIRLHGKALGVLPLGSGTVAVALVLWLWPQPSPAWLLGWLALMVGTIWLRFAVHWRLQAKIAQDPAAFAKANGLTQEQIAKQLGVSPEVLRNLQLNPGTVGALANLFKRLDPATVGNLASGRVNPQLVATVVELFGLVNPQSIAGLGNIDPRALSVLVTASQAVDPKVLEAVGSIVSVSDPNGLGKLAGDKNSLALLTVLFGVALRTDPTQFRELSAKQAEAELAGLTDRERRMLALIAEGYTNRAIGEVLHLSEKTVRNHVSQLLRKLGFQRRSQAAAWAGERRLELPPE
jgi:DNA-binding CsgD family transcriptional regulator